MATATSTGSGNWSAAIWSGGAGSGGAPADGDAVTIAAGHSVLMDSDLSSWTGLQTVTITSHATTPGMLYFKNGTNGYLKLRTGYNIVGTNASVRGRLLANSDGDWDTTTALQQSNTAVIDLQGSATILAQYLHLRLFCATPTNTFVRTYAVKKTVTGSASADTLTNASHGWANGTVVSFRVTGGSLPTPLEADTIYYVVNTATDTFKVSGVSGGTAIDLTTDGSGTIEAYTGHSDTGTKTINVLEDVTGDSAWAVGYPIALCDIDGGDHQRDTIATINAGSIVLTTNNVDSAQAPGSRIWLVRRNVSIRQASTSGVYTINCESNSQDAHKINCEIIATGGSGTTYYNTGFMGNATKTGHEIGGVFCGNSNGCSCQGATISAIILCGTNAVNYGPNTITEDARFAGILNAYTGCGTIFNGQIWGCTSIGNIPIGVVYGSTFIASGVTNTFPNYSIFNGGTIKNCTRVSGSGTGNIFIGTTFISNVADLNFIANNTIINTYINCKYPNGAPVLYTRNNAINNYSNIRHRFEHYLGAINSSKIVTTYGDIFRSACDGTGNLPDVDPSGGNGYCIEASNLQSNIQSLCPLNIIDNLFDTHKIELAAGTYTITYKVLNNFTGGLADNDLTIEAEYISDDSPLTVTRSSDSQALAAVSAYPSQTTDWKDLSITITTAAAGWVRINIYLTKYESGKLVCVWPVPTIT